MAVRLESFGFSFRFVDERMAEEEANVELRAQLIGTRCHTANDVTWTLKDVY